MGSCLDLRKYQESDEVANELGKILSGKDGYKPIVEKRIDPVKCEKCAFLMKILTIVGESLT
jgi:hypothetical protein